jgi:hypothetical protein
VLGAWRRLADQIPGPGSRDTRYGYVGASALGHAAVKFQYTRPEPSIATDPASPTPAK